MARSTFVVALVLAACTVVASAAAPDLTGPWQIRGAGRTLKTDRGEAPPLSPAGAERYRINREAVAKTPAVDPIADCLPPGVPRLMTQAFPFNVVQGRRTIAMMFSWNHLTRLVYMDRPHFRSIGPLYLGQSIGRWEGDVLVIDTNSYNDTTWLDDTGLPHSRALHTVERLRLISGGRRLEDRIEIEDPETFTRTWTARLVFTRQPGVLIEEDYCLGRTGQGSFKAR